MWWVGEPEPLTEPLRVGHRGQQHHPHTIMGPGRGQEAQDTLAAVGAGCGRGEQGKGPGHLEQEKPTMPTMKRE